MYILEKSLSCVHFGEVVVYDLESYVHRVRSRQFDVSSAFGVNLYLNYFFESFFFFSLSPSSTFLSVICLKCTPESSFSQLLSGKLSASSTFWVVHWLTYILVGPLPPTHSGVLCLKLYIVGSSLARVQSWQFFASGTFWRVLCLKYIRGRGGGGLYFTSFYGVSYLKYIWGSSSPRVKFGQFFASSTFWRVFVSSTFWVSSYLMYSLGS